MEQINQAPAVMQESKKVWKYQANGQEITLTADIVRKYLTKGNTDVNDTEVLAFMSLCRYQQLNPFLGEAYLVKFGNNRGGEAVAQIITSKEAFMKRAENNAAYAGFRAGVILKRGTEVINQEGEFMLDGDVLLGGWAEVYRDDRKYPINAFVSLKEYSKGQSTWNAIPCTMIRKVALVHALREAFPSSLGELYVPEESSMPTETISYEEVQNEQKVLQNANKQELPAESPAPAAKPAAPAQAQQEIPEIFK